MTHPHPPCWDHPDPDTPSDQYTDLGTNVSALSQLDEWLSKRRLTHEHLRVGMVIGALRDQYTDLWTKERCLYEVPERGVLLFPAYDTEGAVRGWQTRHRKKPAEEKAQKRSASDCEVMWCGGGKPDWWPATTRSG